MLKSELEGFEGFCTTCSTKILSFNGLEKCPVCGHTGVPCASDNQVEVSINVHELRLLCIWAERWGHAKTDDYNVVYGIARRLRKQLGDKDEPLTMADEFEELRKAGIEFSTNMPEAES